MVVGRESPRTPRAADLWSTGATLRFPWSAPVRGTGPARVVPAAEVDPRRWFRYRRAEPDPGPLSRAGNHTSPPRGPRSQYENQAVRTPCAGHRARGTVGTARSAPRRSDCCAEEDTAWSARTTGPGGDTTRPPRASFAPARRSSSTTRWRPALFAAPILASWTRSREWDVHTDAVEMSCEYDPEPDSPLTRAAKPILADVADQLAGEPVSLILTDADGVVLERRTGDSELNQHLDRVWLAPGFSYAEKFIGTNGIGTALEGRRPVQVFGYEHYIDHLADLACAGAPIWHPVSRKLLGVVDLTCWRPDAGRFMSTAVARIARQIEGALMDQSGPRELALLHDYLGACRRNRGAVLGDQPRPGHDERPGPRADRPGRPRRADRRGRRGDAVREPPHAHRPAQRGRRQGAVPAQLDRPGRRRRRAARPARRARHPPAPRRRARPVGPAARRRRIRAAVGQVLPGRRPALRQPGVARARGRARHRQDHGRPGHPPDAYPGCAPAPARRRRLQPALDRRGHRGAGDGWGHARALPRRPAVRRRPAGARGRPRAAPRVHRPGPSLGRGHRRARRARRRRPHRRPARVLPAHRRRCRRCATTSRTSRSWCRT